MGMDALTRATRPTGSRAHLRRDPPQGRAGDDDPLRRRAGRRGRARHPRASCRVEASGSMRRRRRWRLQSGKGAFAARLQGQGGGSGDARRRRRRAARARRACNRWPWPTRQGAVTTGFAKVEAAAANRHGRRAPACRRRPAPMACASWKGRGAQRLGSRRPGRCDDQTLFVTAIGFGFRAHKCNTCRARRGAGERMHS